MGLLLMVFQLWTQPSVRILGFGREFAGFIPDPITDLIYNPAYLKEIGYGYDKTFNSLQVYMLTQTLGDTVYLESSISYLFRTGGAHEPLSLLVFYPKLGLGFRVGAMWRIDERNKHYPELWLYGQEGFFGALRIGRYLKIGGEYNFSWNNQPDEYEIQEWDSLGNQYMGNINHTETSNELGFGLLIGGGLLQLAISGKKDWELNSFAVDFWEPQYDITWSDTRGDSRLFLKLQGGVNFLKVVLKCNYREWLWNRRIYYAPQNLFIDDTVKFSSFKSGVSVLYSPFRDIIVSAAVIYNIEKFKDGIDYCTKSFIVPVGFERSFGHILKFRFGNTFTFNHTKSFDPYILYPYIFKYDIYNNVNFGLDLYPYQRLNFYFATRDPLNYKQWFFGLSFAL